MRSDDAYPYGQKAETDEKALIYAASVEVCDARYNFADGRRSPSSGGGQGLVMDWARILACVTGTVHYELRNSTM